MKIKAHGYVAALLCCLYMLFGVSAAVAKPLVADLSRHFIAIDSGFAGTDILFFGARNEAGDIIIVVRGPQSRITVHRKERVAGIWMNTSREHFEDVPHYYALATTRPLTEILHEGLMRQLQIGAIHITPLTKKTTPFFEAMVQARVEQGLYTPAPSPIIFMGESLFKTVISFPETIPRGRYTAEVYLVRDGELIGMQATPITVKKQGFDAFIFDMAHRLPLLYGIMAVLVALISGWIAGVIFKKI